MEFKSSKEYIVGIGQDVFQGCGMPPPVVSTLTPHPCPLCKSREITITKESTNQGMDGHSDDWYIRCNHCGLVKTYLAADDFYGRQYYKTMDDAIRRWNEMCEPYDKDEGIKNHFSYNVPDKCKDCKSVGKYPDPLGGKFYCHMKTVNPNNVQQDISTCYVDPETRPEWCPMEKMNKDLDAMDSEKRGQFDKVAEGLSVLFGAASAWKKEE